jgi:hypothetical protein
VTTNRPPRPRDSRGRFVSTRDVAQGRSLIVRDTSQDANEPVMISDDPDSRHLFLSFLVFGVAVLIAFRLPYLGWITIIAFFTAIGSFFSLFLNLVIVCGRHWPKTTLLVLIVLGGMIGGGRRRRW